MKNDVVYFCVYDKYGKIEGPFASLNYAKRCLQSWKFANKEEDFKIVRFVPEADVVNKLTDNVINFHINYIHKDGTTEILPPPAIMNVYNGSKYGGEGDAILRLRWEKSPFKDKNESWLDSKHYHLFVHDHGLVHVTVMEE